MGEVTDAILDTSVLIGRETGRKIAEMDLGEVSVSAVTIGELRWGVLAATSDEVRSRRLDTLNRALALEPIPVNDQVAAAWALLRQQLRSLGRKMEVNDSWIAATALAMGWPVVTQDDGFPDGISGLTVIRV